MGFYKNEIYKQANIASMALSSADDIARNMDDVVKVISKAIGPNGGEAAAKAVNKAVTSGGTGSFVGDAVLGGIKKIPGKSPHAIPKGMSRKARKRLKKIAPEFYKRESRFGSKVDKGVSKYLSTLNNLDMKAGEIAGRRLPGSGNIFKDTMKVKVGDGIGSVTHNVPVQKITAPMSKTVKKATPFLATIGASSLMYPDKENSKDKGRWKV